MGGRGSLLLVRATLCEGEVEEMVRADTELSNLCGRRTCFRNRLGATGGCSQEEKHRKGDDRGENHGHASDGGELRERHRHSSNRLPQIVGDRSPPLITEALLNVGEGLAKG